MRQKTKYKPNKKAQTAARHRLPLFHAQSGADDADSGATGKTRNKNQPKYKLIQHIEDNYTGTEGSYLCAERIGP